MKYLISALCLCGCVAGCGGGGGGSAGTAAQATDQGQVQQDQLSAWASTSGVAISSIDASAGDTFSDLAPFGAAVGDARVVSLTEDTHGDANAFELINRQIQYLHQVKGFDVLMQESSMFDVEAIWRAATDYNASATDLAPGRIFFMYSKTDSARKILQYVDQQRAAGTPLALMGLDIPMGGDTSIQQLVPALQAFLTSRNSTIPQQSSWAEFASVGSQAAAQTLSASASLTVFNSVAGQIEQELCNDSTMNPQMRQTPGWWCLQVRGLAAAATRQTNPGLIGNGLDPRESQMASNVLWVANTLFPNKKVILMSNSGHGLNYDFYCAGCAAGVSSPGSMGRQLQAVLGNQLYMVKNTPFSGAATDYTSPAYNLVVPPYAKGILAGAMKAANKVPGFLNQPSDPVIQNEIPSDWQASGRLGMEWNGIFYYPEATPAKLLTFATSPLPAGM